MFNAIILIIIGICLGLIGFIIFRKFPQVSNLDTENLPEEKELLKKEQIIRGRIEDKRKELKGVWAKRMVPIKKMWAEFQLKFRIYCGRVERLWMHEETLKKKEKMSVLSEEEKKHELQGFLKEGEERLRLGELEKAEEFFIEAIKVDKVSILAYSGLAETYLAKGSIDEAKQTYHFLLQIDPKNDSAMIKLGDLAEERGNIDEAIDFYERAVIINDSMSPRFFHLAELLLKVKQPIVALEAISQAVDLESKNPKYLDLFIETAIICGDKISAEKAYNELRLVNPENQKLGDFKATIARL